VLEDQVVDWVLSQARVTERPMTFAELTGFGRGAPAHEHDHAGHDHAGHDHSGHDHPAHGHGHSHPDPEHDHRHEPTAQASDT
jgi:hypothetical protein